MKPATQPPSTALVIASFAAIYVIWGSTYVAIRVAVETLPPFLSAGCRFLIAGGLLFVVLRLKGVPRPDRAQWRSAAITGVLLLLGGNGLVAWAEKSISSGLTALLIALTPAWFALLDWARPNGVRPEARTVFGIVVGFGGVILLVTGRNASVNGHLIAALAVIVAALCWAGGSLYSKYHPGSASPWMSAAAQMTCGGLALLVAGLSLGEPFTTDWHRVTGQSVAALAYLIVFGSWIAFSAYIYLLQVSTPGRVSTYAYVNPVTAVFLGWLLLGETLSPRMILGMVVIIAGVLIITMPAKVATPLVRGAQRQLARLLS